jgi:hypothetical protein
VVVAGLSLSPEGWKLRRGAAELDAAFFGGLLVSAGILMLLWRWDCLNRPDENRERCRNICGWLHFLVLARTPCRHGSLVHEESRHLVIARDGQESKRCADALDFAEVMA